MIIQRLFCWRGIPLAWFFCSVALIASPAYAAKPKIGKTTLVVKDVAGTSEQLKRNLGLSDDVFQDEFVETGALSASEMRFIDDTRITVGPSSNVVLDEFVYDPDPGKGALVMRMTEGIFRFFSGNMDSTNYSIKAPSVTVGVRGTIIVGAINPDNKAFALLLESSGTEAFLVTQSGEMAVIDKPGQAAIAYADGTVVVGPAPPWLLLMADGMDRVISRANLSVAAADTQAAAAPPPPQALTQATRDGAQTATTTPPGPPSDTPGDGTPPADTPGDGTPPADPPGDGTQPGEKLRGLPRATANQDSDSLPSGLDRAAGDGSGGQANEHGTDPDGGPGGGNNGRDGRDGRDNAGVRGSAGGFWQGKRTGRDSRSRQDSRTKSERR